MSVFYVGITDTNWFSLLKEDYNNGSLGKQVNFWTSGTKKFKAIESGDLFLFKLHNKKSTGENGEIVGGGYFSYYDKMTIPDTWKKYGRGNGRESLDSMMKSLKGIQEKNNMQSSIEIGCIILENVFFLDKWIEEPSDWSKSIVSGKKYSTDTKIGLDLFNLVNKSVIDEIESEVNSLSLKGKERVVFVKARVNQSIFREHLLKKYHTCCLCKVENQALLIASHIKPWAASNADEKLDVENGLLLCPNHDALFDGGFITFDNDGKIVISSRLSQIDRTFTNVIPTMKINLSEKNKEYLEYHRKKIFF
ncbi:HNH endonuclease [Fusobacterium polymorphum]